MKKILFIFPLLLIFCGLCYAEGDFPTVKSGDSYNILITSDSDFITWGRNNYGQCDVLKNVNYNSISTGQTHCLALDDSQNIYSWGDNTYGQCDIPKDGKFKLVSAGNMTSSAVFTDDRIILWGKDISDYEIIQADSSVIKLSSGEGFAVALDEEGKMYFLGLDKYGLSDFPSVSGICDIKSGDSHIIALDNKGKVYAWGDNSFNQCDIPETDDIIEIFAGSYHNALIDKNRNLVCFGGNWENQCDFDDIKAYTVSCGYDHTVVITLDGKIVAAGNNCYQACTTPESFGELKQISNGYDSTAFLDNDGKIYMTGSCADGKNDVPDNIGTVKKISVGGNHTMALSEDGNVYVWGSDIYSLCDVPKALTNVTDISAGFDFCLALQDGKVYAWGYNVYNQCEVPSIKEKIVSVSAGFQHSVALSENGKVYAWGNNYENQLDVPDNMGNVVKISVGAYHVIALNDEGKVFGWGCNDDGQIDFSDIDFTVSDIYAGSFISAISDENNNVVFKGYDEYIPTDTSKYKFLSLGHSNIVGEKENGDIVLYGEEKYIVPSELRSLHKLAIPSSYNDITPQIILDDVTKIEFENYDIWGQGISYYDTTDGNSYGYYREDDVEIPTTGKSDSPYCVSVAQSEWLNYTVNVLKNGEYSLWINSAATSNSLVNVYVNDKLVLKDAYLFSTGGSANFKNSHICNLNLDKGINIIKIESSGGSFAGDFFTIKKVTNEAYTQLTVPGVIKLYQYNTGGMDIGYSSPLRFSNGLGSNKIRPLDYIYLTNLGSYTSNSIVSSFQPKDWLEYTTDVSVAGVYEVYVTSQGNGNANQNGKINLYIDGELAINAFDLGNTSGLTEKCIGTVTVTSPVSTFRIENPSSGSYGYLLGDIRFVCKNEQINNKVTVVPSLNGGYCAKAYYTNTTSLDKPMHLIIALYNGNRLSEIKITDITAPKNSFKEYTSEVVSTNGTLIKAFLWETIPGCDVTVTNKYEIK